MGWVLASHILFRLSGSLDQLKGDKELIRRIRQRLISRNPYVALLPLSSSLSSLPHRRIMAHVQDGLRQGQPQADALAALARLLTVDIDQLSRQRQMTKLLFFKSLGIMVTCLGFRSYFLPWSQAILPPWLSLDLLGCGLSGLGIAACLAGWWRTLPQLRSLCLRQDGYGSWLLESAQPDPTDRQEGHAAEPLAARLRRELASYTPFAEERTRAREDALGIMDLGSNGLIAACTLAAPLQGAFSFWQGG